MMPVQPNTTGMTKHQRTGHNRNSHFDANYVGQYRCHRHATRQACSAMQHAG